MEGILRFQQATDSWVIEHEEHFRILKDDKGQAYGAETITKSIQVEPHSCPGSYPTDIISYDGMKIEFEVVTLAFGDTEEDIVEGDFAKINWETPKNNLSVEEDDDSYSPYCPVCTGCGESGCCSPLHCDPDNPECHYPKTYTEDLKLGYRTFDKWYDLLEENEWFGKKDEFMKIYHEMLEIRFRQDEE
jgi:hypothetical protein